MNIPPCDNGTVIAHDFEQLVNSPRLDLGFMFPCARVCTRCGTLEVMTGNGLKVYFVPWTNRPERTHDPS
jgi:hypothetical protein